MPTAQQVYLMLGNENLWLAASECHRILTEAQIAHSICGGVAVCLHGYQRNTVDINLIIPKFDAKSVMDVMEQAGLEWAPLQTEFRSPSGIAVQFLYSGDRAESGTEAYLPDPEGDSSVQILEGLPVLRLSKLMEIKIARGTGNVRRTHKDLADVVELIAICHLDSSFSRYLHKSVLKTFRELVRNAHGQV